MRVRANCKMWLLCLSLLLLAGLGIARAQPPLPAYDTAPVLLQSDTTKSPHCEIVQIENFRDASQSHDLVVAAIVDRNGRPVNVHVLHGIGMGWDEKAIVAVRPLRFKPAQKDGNPLAANVYVKVTFDNEPSPTQ